MSYQAHRGVTMLEEIRYRLRSDLEITVEEQVNVWAFFGRLQAECSPWNNKQEAQADDTQ